MRIAHVMDWYIPGMGYQENYLIHSQKIINNDEILVVASNKYPKYLQYTKKNEDNDQPFQLVRLPSIIVHNFNILFGLERIIQNFKPDIVHCHGGFNPSTIRLILLKNKLKYKLFVDDHSHTNNFQVNNIIKYTYFNIIKTLYYFYQNRVNLFLPVTSASEIILKEKLNINPYRICQLHLGVNSKIFTNSALLREEGRNQLKLNETDFVLITSGKFTKNKDVTILINSLIPLFCKNKNIKLLMVGNGPDNYREEIQKIIKTYELEKYIIWIDFVINSDLPRYYNASDAGIWPGDHTITALEALGTGLPIILPGQDEAYKIVFDHDAALQIKRGCKEDIQEKIEILINNDVVRKKLKTNALNLVNDILDWDVIAKQSFYYYKKY